MSPRIAVRDISFFERPVPFAKPFRFGSVVINASMQAFVRAEIEVEGKGISVGASAELMASKWFDKRAHLTPRQTVDELRRSLAIAATFIWRVPASTLRSDSTPPSSPRRSRPARKRISRRSPPPSGRLRSTRPSWMRCCVRSA